MVNTVHTIKDFGSLGIEETALILGATKMREVQSVGEGDNRLTEYQFIDGSQPGYSVIDTNANPIFEGTEGYAETLELFLGENA